VLALHAAQLCLGEGTALKLEDVVLPQPLVLPEGQRRSVQALFKAEQAAYTFQLVSLLPAGSEHAALSGSTAIHASGQASLWKESAAPTASLAALRQRCSQPVDLSSFYTGLEAAQIALGPSFRWLEAAWRSAATVPELLVRLAQPPAVESLQGYLLHPGLLDGCFQAAGLFNTSGETLLPFALESLAVQRPATEGEWWCHVTQRSPGRFDLVLLDAAGSTVVQIGGFQMRAASAAAIRGRELWQEWLYTVDWQPRPYFGLPPEFLLPPDQQVAAWQAHARVSDAERSQEAALHAAMEEVSLAFVLSAFRKAGLQLLPGALWRSEHFAGKLSLLPAYRRLLERLLEMLVEAAILQLVPAGWQVLRTPEPTEPAELLAALQVEHGKRPELRLLGRCAARLHDVLRGAQEPLELLFPGGDATEATQLYSDTPTARVLNGLVQRAVSSACAQLPAERGLRILEIGAGTGGTTAGLLPLLPADRSEYLFTDIGPTFLNKAQERFSAFPFVHYQPLNIEEAPAAQNLAHLQADLIVAANVLHATRNLDDTLAHLRQLLQPGGQLLLLEATERRRWLDLTFGLTDGWWRYADSRQGHPLLSPQEWQALLQAHGFAQVELLELDGQAVILAEADSLPSRLPEQSWLILADRQGVGAALASQLHRQGDQVQLVYAAHSAPPPEGALSLEPSAPAQEWQQLLASSWQTAGRTGTAQLPRLHGVVHLWSLDTPALPAALRQRAEPDEKISLDLVAAAEPAVASALQLAQALLQAQVEPAGLWLVTRDSQPVGPAEPLSGVLQSALWGLGKVIGLEHPELQPRCVDLSQDEDVQTQATRLRVELLHPGEDRQIALRSDARYLARLQRCTEQRAAQELALPAGPYRLDISERGLLDALQLRPLERRAPAAGEVEIEVQADGMNFLDVLDVLGLLPFQREALGGECAGTVVRLGDEHSGLAVGDRVAALASGGFRQFVTVSAALVVPIPDVLTFAEAASIPINFLTAWYALQRFSPLRAGARVLIHAAAGGTGMAAVKIAQAAGAEVYATASPAKWAVLRSLGVQHLYPSRTLDFRGQVLEDTDGAGVDFVLNSLTGEGFVESSLALLAPGGRFVEIAKRNIWSEDAVRAFRADVAYHILDVRAEIQNHPHEIRQQLQELLARFESGELPPVPCTTYPISQAISAFRTMQQGQHIGKIVLTAPLHRQKVSIRADATYLITGGLGGLGLASARWLAEEGARHLLLVGRSAPRAEAQAQLQALAELGVQVTVAQADVTDRTQLRAVLGQIDARCPLAGVIHSVGVLDDGALLQQRWERFVPVLAPKLQGAWNLHELTAELPLEFFVLFSSIAGLFGSRGQANHAAANAFLDSFAHYRRQQGLPALSINWGAWSEIGAAAGLVRSAARPLAEQGLGAIDPAQGIASFAWLLSQPVVQAGVAPVQWNTFLQTRKDAFYAGMHQIADRPAAVAAPTTSVRQQLERAPAKERRQLLQGVLRQAVAHVLGLQDPQRIDTRQGLLEMGLDSLMAVELRNQLARTLQQPLPSTLVFDYPTIDALTDFLLQRLGEQQAEPPQTAQPLQPAPDTVSDTAVDAIAVIGMACRFPGGSDTPERFWQLLAEERDAVIALPEGRRALMSATTTAPYYGGFLQEVDTFDPAFFGISPREARLIDPQQRLLLEVGWEALERAGLQPERLFNRPVGVFVGSCSNDYALLVRQQTVDSAQMELHQITGMAQASIAGRLAYLLGFTGPAMVVDTACSSSLVALHQACQSLRSQECDLALAGGVNLILADDWVHPNAEHDKRMHAPDGRCKTFDASADGFGRGEGCGVVVLKRLSQALAEGDTILGVVRGSMVNQDGRSSGFSAPNGPSQQQVIRQAHARAGVQPAQVGYIEAHGTGTALGDPIEVSALSAVFAERTTPLWVGSVKSNIAHLEGAAGIAGVIKVLLSFQQGQIPPNVHFHSPNPYIDWEHSPVQVPVAPVAWGTAEKIAGVSSFGISGTNAHVVLAQAPARAKKMDKPLPTDRRPLQLFTLSARDAAALAAYARSYCDFLEAHPELDLGDIAYTGHVGRSHFSHRLSVKAGSVAELREKLVAAGTGEQETQRGVVAAQQEAPRIAFLFTGQGSQYAGMGRELYETEPMFRESIDRCAALLAGQLEAPLLELLGYGPAAENAASAIDRTENTQPALFALEYALAQLWRSWGVEPEILLGHSVGELAAACVAGVFSLEDGLMLVAARGRLMGALPQEGEMVSLLAAEARVREAIAPYSDELSIAAINGPASVVISGSRDAVLAVSELLAAEGVKSQRLTVSHAFHSPLMEPMLEEFRRVAERVTYHPPHLQLVSNVTGQLAGDEIATAEYWVRHVREAVRFADGVAALHSQGVQIFLEIGPKPVLLGMAGGDSGQWSVVSGQWSVVSGQWPVVSGEQGAVARKQREWLFCPRSALARGSGSSC
jgi:acyl transferase domain-containing protein/acyl carrier protein